VFGETTRSEAWIGTAMAGLTLDHAIGAVQLDQPLSGDSRFGMQAINILSDDFQRLPALEPSDRRMSCIGLGLAKRAQPSSL
jgi:hypothetical protein